MPDITRAEFEEYKSRMHDEHTRQNARIKMLEDSFSQQQDLIITVKEIALTQKGMLEEQKRQGERLDAIEEVPAERWNTVIKHILSAAAGAIGAAIVAAIIAAIK